VFDKGRAAVAAPFIEEETDMKNKMKNVKAFKKPVLWVLPVAALGLFLAFAPAPVQAQTVTTRVVTQEKAPETGARIVNFMDFDMNKDGMLSTKEVGDMLFKLFDGDGNDIIDNVEFEHKAVLTVVPVTKKTVVTYDFDNDGMPDKIQRSYENFTRDTELSRFDETGDGLSPHEFSKMDFMQMDANHDKAIDKKEWQASYIASIAMDIAAHKDSVGLNK
jgi:hypothetical protein